MPPAIPAEAYNADPVENTVPVTAIAVSAQLKYKEFLAYFIKK